MTNPNDARTMVRTAVAADLEPLIDTYSAAIADEGVAVWSGRLADMADPMGVLDHVRAYLERLIAASELLIGERDGAIAGLSVWIEAESAQRFREEAAEMAQQAVQSPALARTALLLDLVASAHPDRPHVFLASMAVRPEHRSQGVGGAMMRHRLRRADEAGLPGYLEASTLDAARMYARHGFESVGDPLPLPYDGPTLHPMWREARATPT